MAPAGRRAQGRHACENRRTLTRYLEEEITADIVCVSSPHLQPFMGAVEAGAQHGTVA